MATQARPSAKPVAIVTGASTGIGRELALIAAREFQPGPGGGHVARRSRTARRNQ